MEKYEKVLFFLSDIRCDLINDASGTHGIEHATVAESGNFFSSLFGTYGSLGNLCR